MMTRRVQTKSMKPRRPLRLGCSIDTARHHRRRPLALGRPYFCFRLAHSWFAGTAPGIVHNNVFAPNLTINPVFEFSAIDLSRAIFSAAGNRVFHSTMQTITNAFQHALKTVVNIHRTYRVQYARVITVSSIARHFVSSFEKSAPLNVFWSQVATLYQRAATAGTPSGTPAPAGATYFDLYRMTIEKGLAPAAASLTNNALTSITRRWTQTLLRPLLTHAPIADGTPGQLQPAIEAPFMQQRRTPRRWRNISSAAPLPAPATARAALPDSGRPSAPRRRELVNVHNTQQVLPLEFRYRESTPHVPVTTTAQETPQPVTPTIDIDRISQSVIRTLNKKMKIERERRGLF